MKTARWLLGGVILLGILAAILSGGLEFPFPPNLPYAGFVGRALYILMLASALCLYRVLRGPTAADRVVAIDILGILIVGFCAVVSIATGRSWYIDIGIAWALQSFIGTLALSKYLEGKPFDE